MKWSIVGLVFFGLVAAFSAAVLVASLRANTRGDTSKLTILVASTNLPRSRVVDKDAVIEKTVPSKEAPKGALTNHVQVVGKVLAMPMVEGEAFKNECFASASSGYRVASVLTEGMRAMTLSLSDYGGLLGILYPGCYVDVLTSFRLPGNEESGKSEAMSMPLLQAVQVLAVEENTLVSEKEEPEGKRSSGGRSKKLLVTLMVDLEQASGLQLALQYGTVSLALRNPLDAAKVKRNQSFLSKLSQVGLKRLAAQLKPVPGSGDAVAGASTIPAPGEQPVDATAAAVPAFADEGLTVDPEGAVLFPTGGNTSQAAANDLWKVTILRGNVITTQSLAIPSETGK
jgi:Flp pilus assembly protein CpaB